MDIKAKMEEIMQFFQENSDDIYAKTGISFHVMFKTGEEKGDFLQSAGGERTNLFLMLMYHIDALRRSGTPETMGIDNNDVFEWMTMLSMMYLSTIGDPERINNQDDRDNFQSTITKIPKII